MSHKSAINFHFYLKNNKKNNQNEAPLYVRITAGGNRSEISLNVLVDSKKWDPNPGNLSDNSSNSKRINRFIEETKYQLYNHVKKLKDLDIDVCSKSIKESFLGLFISERSLIELCDEHNDRMKKLIGIEYAKGTYKKYKSSFKNLKEFVYESYHKDDIYLNRVDYEFIVKYVEFLKLKKKNSHNTAMKHLINLKKIINYSLNNDWIRKNPFSNYKIKKVKTDRGFLSEEELSTLIKKKFDIERLNRVKDCFLFSCFTGLAYSDLKNLTKENIVNGTDDKKWIKIRRLKTDEVSTIPILPVTDKIINKYKFDYECKIEGKLLPVNSNQKMNAYLKEIATICKIEQNLSSHLARHTFATTVTLNNDVPIESVSKMLGHSSIKMTKIYARLLDKKVSKDTQHLHNKFNMDI